jgi:CBS domain-containing protein
LSVSRDIKSFQEQVVQGLLEARPVFPDEERVSRAIGYLRESGNYEVFIRNEKRLLCVTVRDLISIANPTGMKLDSIAFSVPEIEPDDSISDAARLMFDYRLRALPCFKKSTEVSAISARAISYAMNKAVNLSNTASEIMSPNPVTINSEDSALKAKDIMTRRSFDHLPVMKNGKLSGIVTSSDLLFNLLPEERASQARGVDLKVRFDYPIERIAQDSVVEVEPTSKISQVIEKMSKNNSSYVLVRLWDELQGIITLRDVLKPLLKRKESTVPYYIVGLPNDPFEAETARMKLERLGTALTRAFPSIKEVRAIIKTKEISEGRRRYEVSFNVYLQREMHAYVEEGYSLAEIFDRVGPKLKKLLTMRQSKVTRSAGRTIRKGIGSIP